MKTCLAAVLSLAVFSCAAAAPSRFVTYEQFGAVGDGVADDQAAIVAAHAVANEKGLPVKAGRGKTYRIGGGDRVAVISTDVDFGDAKFIIDDTSVKNRQAPVFCVESRKPPFEIDNLKPLVCGAGNIGKTLPSRCHIELVYNGKKRYIREGLNRSNGEPQQEVVLVDADGRIDPRTPVLWDYPSFTRVTARPVDNKTLVIKGGDFTTIANRAESKYNYHSRGIRVERSNVRIRGLSHAVTDELDHGAPYLGFIEVFHASDVAVEDCVFTAHRTYNTIGAAGLPVDMGSYDITVNNSAIVTFLNCRQTTDILDRRYWGLFSSNYSKALTFDDCVFSRFDAHKGVAGATVRNCDIGYMGLNALGFGTFLVEKTRVRSSSFFNLRGDYGSTWDGELVVKDCVFAPTKCAKAFLVLGWHPGKHDFGYPCSMPRKVTFEGLRIDDSAVGREGVYLFSDFVGDGRDRGEAAPNEYKLTEKAVLANVVTTSGREVRISPNLELFKDLVVERTEATPPVEIETGAVFGNPVKVPGVDRKALSLALEGDRLYVGAGAFLCIYDISNPLSPRKLGELSGFNALRQIAVQNGMAYVVTREYGLWIVDATDPAHPRVRSHFDCCELATGVDVAGGVCFLAMRQYGVEFVDVSDPDNPRHIAMRKTDESQSVKYRDGYLYSGEWGAGKVTVFDVHDMGNIRQVACEELHGFGDGVWLQGDYLYCATGHHSMHRKIEARGVVSEDLKKYYNGGPETGAGMGHGLDVFDVSDPSHPKHVSRLDYPPLYSRWLDMWTPRTSGNLLMAAQTHNGLFAVDISDKANPRVLDRLTFPDPKTPEFPGHCVSSLAIGEGVVYAAVMDEGLFAIPAKGAKRRRFRQGRPPLHPEYREPYPTDEKAWHVWQPPTPGQARAVAVRGDVVYAACGDAGLWALAIEPSGGFRALGKLPGHDSVMDVSVFGNRLFTAEGADGFGVYELTGPAEFREIARLARIAPGRNLALCVTAVDSNWAFFSDRHGTDLFDISALPDFKHILHDGRTPGWHKYLQDRPVGNYIAYSNAHQSLDWIDLAAKPSPVVSLRTQKNNLRLHCGICAFRDGLSLASVPGGYVLLSPNEGDAPDGDGKWKIKLIPPAAPGREWRWNGGMPRSDGRQVVFTSRIDRLATLYDFADKDNPVPCAAWKFSGTPDIAQFYNGRVIIPCGYQGVLLQRSR